jgi:hypothetical protein
VRRKTKSKIAGSRRERQGRNADVLRQSEPSPDAGEGGAKISETSTHIVSSSILETEVLLPGAVSEVL